MTQVFDETGIAIPVTVIQAGPCTVTQVKTEKTDGYSSVQIGFGDCKEKALNRPKLGHLKKNLELLQFVICVNIAPPKKTVRSKWDNRYLLIALNLAS